MNTEEEATKKEITLSVIVTQHAYERAKERLNWKRSVVDKMAIIAYTEGVGHNKMKGTLSRYITKLWHTNKEANNIRIYGETIFFFSHNILITLYQLPTSLKKHKKYH